jgi:hypothetical protein
MAIILYDVYLSQRNTKPGVMPELAMRAPLPMVFRFLSIPKELWDDWRARLDASEEIEAMEWKVGEETFYVAAAVDPLHEEMENPNGV